MFETLLKQREIDGSLRILSQESCRIDFCSNDYLGMARSEELKNSYSKECETAFEMGFGSTGSRLLTGNNAYAENLERAIALRHGFEAGLLFNCGYMANLGLLSTIAGKDDLILFDRDIHASIHDGMRLGKAKCRSFAHNSLEHLEQVLKRAEGKNRFVVVESLYSIDGSVAPLKELEQLCLKYDARLVLDEAHASGLYGELGLGLVEANHVKHVFAKILTFGKAYGVGGAIVLGSAELRTYLINFCRPFIYTTALPRNMLAAIKCSFELMPTFKKQRKQLYEHIDQFQKQFVSNASTPIHQLKIRGNEKAKKAVLHLSQLGLDVRALLSPTVRRGEECLRICLHSFNTKQEVDDLMNKLSV